MLDDRIAKAKWLTKEERNCSSAMSRRRKRRSKTCRFGKVLTSRACVLLSLTYFSFVMGLYGVSFWLPTIIKATGVTDAFMIGLLSAIPFAAAVVGMVFVARSADRRGERRWHIALPAFDGGGRARALGGVGA